MRNSRFGLWAPVFLWAGLIFGISSIPSLDTGWGLWDFMLRKIAHVTEYAILTALLIRAFERTWPQFSVRKIIVWVFLLALGFAVSDEFHQSFVPGRGPSAVDVGIDSLGVIAVCLFYYMRGWPRIFKNI